MSDPKQTPAEPVPPEVDAPGLVSAMESFEIMDSQNLTVLKEDKQDND